MVQRLKGKPFTLLGINSDKDRSVLRKALKDEKITWPNIYGGPTSNNAIARRWGIVGWPTLYVVDHEGIIRYNHLDGAELEAAVDALLARVPASRQASASAPASGPSPRH